jgi:pimeloyl-ACP methyl ester carboxylesterase
MAVKTAVDLSFGSQANPRLKEMAAQRMLEVRFSVLNGDFLACDAYDEANLLGRIKAPTLIICGAEDKMTPVRYSQVMNERIKKSLLHVVDGAGHNVMIEQPLTVANLLQLFLNNINYNPGSGS